MEAPDPRPNPGKPPNKLLKFFLLTSQMFLENYGCAA
jgi:hypothetical protein